MVLVAGRGLRGCAGAVDNTTSSGSLCYVEIQGHYGDEICSLLPEL